MVSVAVVGLKYLSRSACKSSTVSLQVVLPITRKRSAGQADDIETASVITQLLEIYRREKAAG